ncbi:MAG: helix-turn-helix domain-containing protein [Puniceicoccales bacterium]|jgi:excisionase family DNA binding protein|nr:helix-turn-helix domain-containing protein [Puniceicoccales bacterium]
MFSKKPHLSEGESLFSENDYYAVLTIGETAKILRLNPGTLYNWIYNKTLPVPSHKIGNRRIFFRGEVMDYLKSLHEDAQGREGVE